MRRMSLFAFLLLAPTAIGSISAQSGESVLAQKQLAQQKVAQSRADAQQRRERIRAANKLRLEKRRAEVQRQRAERDTKRKERLAARQEIRDAQGFRRIVAPPQAVSEGQRKLTESLAWHADLDKAQETAQRTGKPIVWIHALGDLRGVL